MNVVCLVEEGVMKRKFGPIDELPLQEAARLRLERGALRDEVKRLRAQLGALQSGQLRAKRAGVGRTRGPTSPARAQIARAPSEEGCFVSETRHNSQTVIFNSPGLSHTSY